MSMSTLECAPHSSLSSNPNPTASSSSALNSFSISCSSSSFDDVLSPHSSSLPSLSPPLSAHNNNNSLSNHYYLDYQSPQSYHHHSQISNQSSNPNLQHDESLGSCELNPDPLWPKMNAVVGGTAAKKRKKPDIKPQSQIAKCLNEKRRREQENNYIEELAELISAASFAESMNSLAVKPDKCAILQETVNQIRNIKQQETSSDAVQQGEVSSTKPTEISNEVLGPLLLEALEGFLFVVNPDGYVDFCTENIRQFIRYTRQEVLGKSVYNLIHHGDHARFHNTLVPAAHQLSAWQESPGSRLPITGPVNRTFTIRLLVKPPDELEETMEEKQQRVYKYENMQISSTHLASGLGRSSGEGPDDSGDVSSEAGPCLMCVARRLPTTDKALSSPIEQFTMKLDRSGTIIGMDTSGVSQVHAQYLNKDLKGRRVQDLCHSHDTAKFSSHISSCLGQGTASLALHRLRVGPDRYLHVQTKSKLFRANNGEPDFIMATLSIINDNDVTVVMETTQQQLQLTGGGGGGSSGLGGPMMGGGGGVNGSAAAAPPVSPAPAPTTFQSFNLMEEFVYFPAPNSWDDVVEPWGERPASRVSEPPPPSPLNPPSTPSYNSFPFSPLEEREREEGGSESGRLRTALLQQRPTSIDSDEGSNASAASKGKNRILKVLLNPGDPHDKLQDEENKATNNNNNNNNSSSNNNMLLSLLNTTKPEDDSGPGIMKKNQLLSQLLKEDEKLSPHHHTSGPGALANNFSMSNSHGGLQSSLHLGSSYKSLYKEISSSPSSPELLLQGRPRKRPSEESDDGHSAKRVVSILDTLPSPSPSLNQGGNSELQKKNKMLASLLAQEPKNANQPVPPISQDIISATPQEKLPRVVKQVPPVWSGGSVQQQQQQRAPSHGQGRSLAQLGGAKHPLSLAQWSEAQWPTDSTDKQFSEILEGIIDIVPDAIVDPSNQLAVDELLNFFNATTNPAKRNLPQEQAIRQIERSLIQWGEATTKPPSYNINQPQQQAGSQQAQGPSPPQLSHLHAQAAPVQQAPQYPPPPMYQQRPRFSMQQGIRSGSPQYAIGNQAQMVQQRQKLIQQQRRLLQLQQQQQVVIPPSHAQQADHNLDLITVAPNVSLQRSNSVPDSPSGGYTMLSSGGPPSNSSTGGQMSPRSQPPSAQQSPSYLPSFSNGLRLSPNQGGSPFQQSQQLSPRVSQPGSQAPSYSQQNTWTPPQQQQQQAQVTNSNQQTRLSIQQQQNPMLSAQLTGNSFPVTTRVSTAGATPGYLSQQQPSPRATQQPRTPHSPFPPESPNPAASYQPGSQFRLSQGRVTGVQPAPSATTHLPGVGLRHYNAMSPHHGYSPDQSPSPYCYDTPLLYPPDRGRLAGSGQNNGVTDYVRQEIRAIVGARQQGPRPPQQISVGPGQSVSAADCEALGLYLEMPSGGGGNESPKMTWSSLAGGDMGVTSPPHRNSSDSNTSDQKASLLQKLLSE